MLAKIANHPLEQIPASFPAGERWFVFHAHSRKEAAAGEDITALGYRTFVPIEKLRNKRPHALFPRYGFCRFDINDAGWGAICEVKGVVDLLRTNGIPRAVPDAVMDALHLADEMGLFDHTQPPKVGTQVEVMDGPFASEIGRICRAPRRKRADVLLRVLGGDRIVSVPLTALREA